MTRKEVNFAKIVFEIYDFVNEELNSPLDLYNDSTFLCQKSSKSYARKIKEIIMRNLKSCEEE